MLAAPASSSASAADSIQPAAAPAFYGPLFAARPDLGPVAERSEGHAASRGVTRTAVRPAAVKPARRQARPVAKRTVRRLVVHKARRLEHTTVRQARRIAGRTHATRYARRASGRGAIVVAYAKAQLNRMYSFGRLDCSGLTKGAYSRVGVYLPHKASQQDEYGSRVSAGAARAGDLVFWGGDNASHVAVYIGGGRVIHAPGRGRRVQIAKVWGNPTYVRVH